MLSKKDFLRSQGKPAVNVEREYSSVSEGDKITERYSRPIGWLILGIAFVAVGVYLLFFLDSKINY